MAEYLAARIFNRPRVNGVLIALLRSLFEKCSLYIRTRSNIDEMESSSGHNLHNFSLTCFLSTRLREIVVVAIKQEEIFSACPSLLSQTLNLHLHKVLYIRKCFSLSTHLGLYPLNTTRDTVFLQMQLKLIQLSSACPSGP